MTAENRQPLLHYGAALLLMAAVTAALLPVHRFLGSMPGTAALAQMIVIVVIGIRWGAGPALLAATVAVVSFAYFFFAAEYAFAIPDLNLGVFLLAYSAAALAVAHLSGQAKRRAEQAEAGKQEIKQLYAELKSESDERRRAEETLRDSELQYRDMIEAAPEELQNVIASVSDAVWSAETYGRGGWRCRYCSPVIERITGQPAEYFIGHAERWLEAVHAEDRQSVVDTFERISGGRSSREENEYRFVLPDGGIRWLRDSMTATRLGDGRLRIDGVIGDVTALRQAEQERQARLAAEAASRAKGDFLAAMSHELRSPLNIILGFARSTTRTPGLAPAVAEDLRHIVKGGEYLQTLINQVLDLSKLEAGRTGLSEEDFDLACLLSDLHEMFAATAAGKGLQLRFSCAPPVPRRIRADPLKLRQILINLIDNALKFTHAGGVDVCVDVDAGVAEAAGPSAGPGAADAPERLAFSVADTGEGIAPEEIAHVFDAFVQTAAGRRARQGTGLGLALSRGFVRRMGGEITIDSALGEGTRVRFEIPVRFVHADEAAVEPMANAEGATSPLPNALAALPQVLRRRLAKALRELDTAEVDLAIAAVAARDGTLAETLAAIAGEFQYEQILSLLRESDARSASGSVKRRATRTGSGTG